MIIESRVGGSFILSSLRAIISISAFAFLDQTKYIWRERESFAVLLATEPIASFEEEKFQYANVERWVKALSSFFLSLCDRMIFPFCISCRNCR